jgi:hypothetical protein
MGLKEIDVDGVTFSVSEGSGQAEKLQQLIEARDELAEARKEIERMRTAIDRTFKGLASAT